MPKACQSACVGARGVRGLNVCLGEDNVRCCQSRGVLRPVLAFVCITRLCPTDEPKQAAGRGQHTGNKGIEHMDDEDSTLITAEVSDARLEQSRERIAETLEQLWEDIESLRERLRGGEDVKPAEAGKAMADLRYWLKAARETEAELETLRQKRSGIVGSYGLDLAEARDVIGCRMAQLRPCCRSE